MAQEVKGAKDINGLLISVGKLDTLHTFFSKRLANAADGSTDEKVFRLALGQVEDAQNGLSTLNDVFEKSVGDAKAQSAAAIPAGQDGGASATKVDEAIELLKKLDENLSKCKEDLEKAKLDAKADAGDGNHPMDKYPASKALNTLYDVADSKKMDFNKTIAYKTYALLLDIERKPFPVTPNLNKGEKPSTTEIFKTLVGSDQKLLSGITTSSKAASIISTSIVEKLKGRSPGIVEIGIDVKFDPNNAKHRDELSLFMDQNLDDVPEKPTTTEGSGSERSEVSCSCTKCATQRSLVAETVEAVNDDAIYSKMTGGQRKALRKELRRARRDLVAHQAEAEAAHAIEARLTRSRRKPRLHFV